MYSPFYPITIVGAYFVFVVLSLSLSASVDALFLQSMINPIIHYFSSGFISIFLELHKHQTPFLCIYRNYAFFPFQVAFGIDLNAVNDPDSLFPAAIKECLVAPVWCLSHPLHAIDFTTYGYQNTVVAAVHFL